MAVTTFIPQVWEAKLLNNFHKASIADVITTPPTEIKGNKVIFNRVGSVAVKDYAGSVTFDDLTTTSVELNMDQEKYFAFKVKDVDKVQAAGELVDSHTQEAAATLQETVDSYILGLYTGAHADNTIGNDTTPIALDKANVYDYIVDLGTKLSQKKVPKAGRYVVINSAVLGLLSKDDRFTSNPTTLENGVVEGAKINGMQVVVSEELANVTGKLKIMALHQSAIGYGKQIDETEALRLEGDFADGIRGLMVYGSEVIRSEALAVLTATVA
ncbi:P22 phage major capsid protein family protein [Bacillus weihaiensis]|uniref:P22 phage major capsid protein family protein n=1 Tax=Bacillus weihaiensis TaxID=1547283 RepID=UPI00235725E4|nr:P22 phage major capsid protein family protein [Bacillus weihaiensis]